MPRQTAVSAAETTGSDALTMCVNETAPAPSEMTAPMCVPRWPSATGGGWVGRHPAGARSVPAAIYVASDGATERAESETRQELCREGKRRRRSLQPR